MSSDLRPDGETVFIYPGDEHTFVATYPSSLAGRTFTATLGGVALATPIVNGATLSVSLAAANTAAEFKSTKRALVVDEVGGNTQYRLTIGISESRRSGAADTTFTMVSDTVEITMTVVGGGSTAANVAFTPAAGIAATTVQAAIEEVVADIEAGDVDSVNGRTGTVTGLAEQADLDTEAATRADADTALDVRLDTVEADLPIVAETTVDVTVVNTVVEADLCSLATPLGLAVGDRLIFRAGGDLFNNAGTSTWTWRLKIGATILVASNAVAVGASTLRRRWFIEAVIALDGLAVQQATGFMIISLAAAPSAGLALTPNAGAYGSLFGEAAEDLATSKNVVFTVQHGTGDPAVETVIKSASLERLRKAT